MNPDRIENEAAASNDGREARGSWADVLGKNIPSISYDKNVLEIVLEKDEKGPFQVSQDECARLMRKVGLQFQLLEEVQICPSGRGVIFITLKKEVQIEQFCCYDVLEVNNNGVRAINVKPLNKREVIVTIKNVHPNTRDDEAIRYLNLFGKVTSTKVVYGVFGEGPFKGLRNGIRCYKMDLRPDAKLGTYHVLYGQKVIIKYPGQMQTCGRCHQTAKTCKGKGIAKKCQEEGGEKVDFIQYILSLWKQLGYSPDQEPSPEHVDEVAEDEIVAQEGGNFTPKKSNDIKETVFPGICLKRFSQDTNQCEVIELLRAEGLPEENVNEIEFKENGCLIIKNLASHTCRHLINTFHKKTLFGNRIFCNGIVTLTPEKGNDETHINETRSTPPPPLQAISGTCEASKPAVNCPSTPLTFTQLSSNNDINLYVKDNQEQLDRENLARRHSLSLRSPPLGSLGAELLQPPPRRQSFDRTKELLKEVQNMSTRLSEYGSCMSTDDEASTNGSQADGFSSFNSRKRGWKSKRKSSTSPTKEFFYKKANTKQ